MITHTVIGNSQKVSATTRIYGQGIMQCNEIIKVDFALLPTHSHAQKQAQSALLRCSVCICILMASSSNQALPPPSRRIHA